MMSVPPSSHVASFEPAPQPEYPLLETPVIVTMDDGTEFRAMRIWVEDGEGGCPAWATCDEYEPNAPPCWDDGICWASNADGQPSRAPVAWRPI